MKDTRGGRKNNEQLNKTKKDKKTIKMLKKKKRKTKNRWKDFTAAGECHKEVDLCDMSSAKLESRVWSRDDKEAGEETCSFQIVFILS